MLDYRNIADTSFFLFCFFTRLLLIVDAGVAGGINVLMVKIFVIVLRGPFGNLPREKRAVERRVSFV